MTLTVALSCAATLLATAIVAVIIGRSAVANALIYGLCATAALISLFAALKHLLGAASAESMVLPLGIPWIGSHFRIDALSAFFLAVVDLGAVTASVFAIGYGRHEAAPSRVLPFYPAFATPDPKWVVAVGDCALDGGIFAGSYAVAGGVSSVVPVDLHIRGCPPRPVDLLKGLLALLEWQSAG
jgi:NADH ubiquinone oxidoreductase, 20 Kd subunit